VDATLQEALRVTRPGGLILIETIGELNSWEARQAFDPEFQKPATPLGALDGVRSRFARHGVSIQILTSCIGTIRFPDFYEWLRYQCCTWNDPRRAQLSCDCGDAYQRLMTIAGDAHGRISITRHTIWIGGAKED